MNSRLACLSVLLLGCACSSIDTKESQPAEEEALAFGLQPLSTCTELDELVREKARASMNEQLDEAIVTVKANTSNPCPTYSTLPVAPSTGSATGSSGATATVAPVPAVTSTAPTSVSETNNQVVGVDEADLVKTDGQFIYLTQGDELRILKAWPATETALVSRLALGGTAKKLFIEGDRALVYVSLPRVTTDNSGISMGAKASDCTYGYGCDFSGDGTKTQIQIFDLGDRSAPSIARTIDLSGSLIAARRIGTTVHTVVSIGELKGPTLETYYANTMCGSALAEDAIAVKLADIEAMRDRNNAVIDTATFNVGVLAREGNKELGSPGCSDFYRENLTDGVAVTTVLSLDMAGSSAPTLANVVSRAGAVYASDSSLYIAVPHLKGTGYNWYSSVAEDEASTVHRFRIGTEPTKTAYLASGIVPGHVLNQFGMDEYEGVLRIATSKGQVPDPKVESVLSVLKQDGPLLKTIGQIGGIAPTEDIRSVRFQGPRGYVVTFKKTDPLFVLELSDPTQPKLVGELKIPGFSTYMHPLGDNYLLALGYEADDQGTFAYFNGIQLQLFDVTKPTEPMLLHKKVYGTRGSSSSALTDHLGFTYLPTRNLLTLPMNICDGGGNGQYGTLAFSGVVALDVQLTSGFAELGRLEEPYSADVADFQYGRACADWWTDSNSVVQRTVVMDDFLYAVSDHRVRVQDLKSLGTDVKIVDL